MTLSPGRHAARTPGASVALTPSTPWVAFSAFQLMLGGCNLGCPPEQYPRSPHATCSAPTRLPFPSGRFRFTFAFFVDQAARETLSATLTPRTAAGGADGERWAG